MRSTWQLVIMTLILALAGVTSAQQQKGTTMKEGNVLLHEDFSGGMDNWWVEGGEKVWIEDGHLHVKAENRPKHVATVWCKQKFPADVQVDFDAHVVSSPIEANNINFFLCYSDPSGTPLFETREARKTAGYRLYHGLNGHIFTFLNDFKKESGTYPDGSTKGRIRMRRCPGFRLMTETYDYHCKRGVTYNVTIKKRGGDITFAVDGKVYLKGKDDQPLGGGLLGLRTFATHLWWDNIRVTALAD